MSDIKNEVIPVVPAEMQGFLLYREHISILTYWLVELCNKCYGMSKKNGFWTGPENDNLPTKVCLMHSELSELLEAFRKDNPMCEKRYQMSDGGKAVIAVPGVANNENSLHALTGVEEEVADLMIRLCDFCGRYEINLGAVVAAKMLYNAQRPYKHGGKKV